jgi:HlyD family secretion protein
MTTTVSTARVARRTRGTRRGWMWVALLAAVAIGFLAYQRYRASATTAAPVPTTTAVTRGDLSATVPATGNLEPVAQVDLNFTSGGTVKEVLVRPGDSVTAGQPLVRLETRDLELAITTAQASLESAKLKLEQARQGAAEADIATAQSKVDSAKAALDGLYAGPTPATLADAQARIVASQAQLTKARQGSATAADIQDAQARIATAQANLDRVKAGATDQILFNAQQKVEQTKNALWAAQSSRDSICGRTKDPDNDSTCQNARAQVNQQEANVQIAQNDLAALQAGPTSTDVTVAEQTLRQAQESLQKLYTVNPNDITVAEQNVAQAQAALQKLKEGPTAANVAQAEANVAQVQAALDALLKGPDTLAVQVAQTSVTHAEAQLKQAQYKLEQATLAAPIAGTVAAVNATAGASIGASSNPVRIADLSRLQIKTQVSELDRARLQVGQTVQVKLEALSGKTLAGKVVEISPTGASSNGVVNYATTVELTGADASAAAGMTATLSIVTASKQGVLIVPNAAIRTVGNRKLVSVLRDDDTVNVPVTTGLTDGSRTEVTAADLKEGDLVVTSAGAATTTATTPTGGPGGAGGLNILGGASGRPAGAPAGR